jgi:hypothetical protein
MKKLFAAAVAALAMLCLSACSEIAVQRVSVPEELKLLVGESSAIDAAVYPDNATSDRLVWTSSQPEIVSVSEQGTVTGLRAGQAVVTASSIFGPEAKCTVTVVGGLIEDGQTQQVVNGVTGQVFDSITEAVETAGSGDILGIAPGIYSESVTIDRSLTLVGTGAEECVIRPAAGENALSVADNVSLDLRKVTVSVSGAGRGIVPVSQNMALAGTHIRLSDAQIDYSQSGRGIALGTDVDTHDNHIVLERSKILCVDADGRSSADNRGISIFQSADSSLTIRDSEISAGHYALTLNSPGLKVSIENSALTGYAALNIHNKGSEITVENSTLVGRTFWSSAGNTYAAVVCDTAVDTTIRIANTQISNEYGGDATGIEMGIQLRNTGNKLYLDAFTYENMRSVNHAYTPWMLEVRPGNEWYLDGVPGEAIDLCFYVSSEIGSDEEDSGDRGWSAVLPFATLDRAIAAAEAYGSDAPVTVYVFAGEYVTEGGVLPEVDGVKFILDEGVIFHSAD